MAKKVKTINVSDKKKSDFKKKSIGGKVEFSDFWGTKNILFLVLGILFLVLGFYLMSVSPWDSSSALNYSPLLLLAAYLILFPLSILIKKKK